MGPTNRSFWSTTQRNSICWEPSERAPEASYTLKAGAAEIEIGRASQDVNPMAKCKKRKFVHIQHTI